MLEAGISSDTGDRGGRFRHLLRNVRAINHRLLPLDVTLTDVLAYCRVA